MPRRPASASLAAAPPGLDLHVASLRGLGRVTARELRQLFGAAVSGQRQGRTRNLDLTRFTYAGDPADLWRLGTVEDIYAHLETLALEGGVDDLGALTRLGRHEAVDAAVRLFEAAGRHHARRPRVRVVVQASDRDWRQVHRRQLQAAFLEGLLATHPKWRPVADDADLEFWVQLVERRAWVGLRLSDAELRHRDYKVEHRPGSLRPTVARAMAFLGGAGDGDVVVDPVCGAGTLLIERALMGRCGVLVGGDVERDAVDQARGNFGRRHRPRGLCRWDAGRLPLADGIADVLLANLPWGHRVRAPVTTLYRRAVPEVARVLRPGGRAVLLTSETDVLDALLAGTPSLYEMERVRGVSVLGRSADLVVLGRA